jgi:integrase
VFPIIGQQNVNSIVAADVMACYYCVLERAGNGSFARVDTAKRVIQMISQVLASAITSGLATSNPATGLQLNLQETRPPVLHRAAVTTRDDLQAFVRDLYQTELGSLAIPVLKMILHTGQRPGEVRKMRWADIDRNVWTNKVTKVGIELQLPLSSTVIRLLNEMRFKNGNREYVFASIQDQPISDVLPSNTLKKLGWGDRQTAHGLRATFRTLVVEDLGYAPHLAEAQLSHISKEQLGRAYDRTSFLEERRVMMEAWSEYINNLLGEKENLLTFKAG